MQLFVSPYIKPNAMTCIRTVIKFWTQDVECVVCVCLHTTWITGPSITLRACFSAISRTYRLTTFTGLLLSWWGFSSGRGHLQQVPPFFVLAHWDLLHYASPPRLSPACKNSHPHSAPPGQGLSIWALLVSAQRFGIWDSMAKFSNNTTVSPKSIIVITELY